MSKLKSMTIIMLFFVLAVIVIPVLGNQVAYAAADFTSGYVKEKPNAHYYYNNLNGKTIVFNKYDASAELYPGEKQPYNFYELAYWNSEVDGYYIRSKG